MNREALLALGLTEDQVNQIMGMHGSATQNLRTQVTTLTNQLAAVANPQPNPAPAPQPVPTPQPNPTPQDPPNDEMEQLRQQVAQLQSENAKKDILAYATSKGLTGEQVTNVLAAFGDNVESAKASIDAICSIISTRETAAATAKEQELANKAGNPGGGTGAGGGNEKSNAEKLVEKFFSEQKQDNSILSHYLGGN